MTFYVPESTAKDAQRLGGELPSHYATEADLEDIQNDMSAVEAKLGTGVFQTQAQNAVDAVNELNTHLNGYSYKPFVFSNVVFTNGYVTVDTGITGYTSFIPIVDNHGSTTKVVYESVNNGVVTLMAIRYSDGSVASYTESEIHMIVAYK